jgi:hypothetical protein
MTKFQVRKFQVRKFQVRKCVKSQDPGGSQGPRTIRESGRSGKVLKDEDTVLMYPVGRTNRGREVYY